MKLGFLGGGNIAEAIIYSVLRDRIAGQHAIFVNDVNVARRDHLKREFGVNVYSHSGDVVAAADVLLLAVKPQDLTDLLETIGDRVTDDQVVVSIAAGRTIASIETGLPRGRVVRVMPNLPCKVGAGMSAFCCGKRVLPGDARTVRTLLESFGLAIELPESQFDAVTALSGSGPAFFAFLLDRMVDAGVANGLDHDDAMLMAEQTMLGTARVLLEQSVDPKEFIRAVTSKGGTTAAGLTALDCDATTDLLRETIRRAAMRSAELSS